MLTLPGENCRAKMGKGRSKHHGRKQGLSLTARGQTVGKEGA